MNFRLLSILLASASLATALQAQENSLPLNPKVATNGYFNHLDLGLNAGSTGVGIDLAAPIGPAVRLRAGFTYMPRFEMTSNFGMQVGDEEYKRTYDPVTGERTDRLGRMIDYMYNMTGMLMKDNVDMKYKPTYYNSKVLVDVYPLRDKRWHVTAGFYWGSKEIGRAVNSVEDAQTLSGVSMYNYIYDKVIEGNPNIFGDLISITPDMLDQISPLFKSAGRMGFPVGHYKEELRGQVPVLDDWGFPMYDDDDNPIYEDGVIRAKGAFYMMTPDPETGTVKCKAYAKRFKPYVGAGYSGTISKDGLWHLDVDAGALFWGGSPDIYTHDGTCLTRDVENIGGKVGRYVDFISQFKVFPVLELRISRRLF